jgi:hypothetical protein
MSRLLRIEYSGAWYHVMNRGRRGEEIFTIEEDRGIFVHLLKESVEQWDVKVAAYCLGVLRYIHRNPLRAGITEDLDTFPGAVIGGM